MKTHLLHRDQDFNWTGPLPANAEALIQDLELSTLFAAMSAGDAYLLEIVPKVVLHSTADPQAILYRQWVLSDCLTHPTVVQELYGLAGETLAGAKKVGRFYLTDSPASILSRNIEMLEYLVLALQRIRGVAQEQAGKFQSAGLIAFFAMLTAELDDAYFATIAEHLKQMRFRPGVLISAALGQGNHGHNYVLRSPHPVSRTWWEMLTGRTDGYSFVIADRDEAGARALADLQGRGVNLVANALAQSNDHILSFFDMLRAELAFYLGCINLHIQLAAAGRPVCFPAQYQPGRPGLTARGLYDVGLAMRRPHEVIGNDVDAAGRSLIIITGANQGGKSTFLRSLGAAQLMFQCGMFVAATGFTARACTGIFTHYKREEDATMSSGKLDEELARMSQLVDQVRPESVVLFNESFAATNEREGSEIARQIVHALAESGVYIWFVTHLFDFADSLRTEQSDPPPGLFLRAERTPGGGRTFHLVAGEPLPTSYGQDLYQQIFNPDDVTPVNGHRAGRQNQETP